MKAADTVEIVDSNASAFAEFLQFVYLPEVTMTMGNIEEIVRLADKYDMMDCFETCAAFLQANLTTENMLWGYQLAITLKNAPLMTFCEKDIQINTQKMLKSEAFLQCSRDVVDNILKMDTLECDEIDLFNTCIEWAKKSCEMNGVDENNSEELRTQLGPCFNSIRFGAMEGEKIAILLQNKVIQGLFTRAELIDLWTKQSKFFNHQPRLKPYYTWDSTNVLICKRRESDKNYFIREPEPMWFSTNQPVLLGEIFLGHVYRGFDKIITYFDIQILECCTENFATDAPMEQLFTKNNITNEFVLLLSPPIRIQPHKFYEIRLLFNDLGYQRGYLWVPEVRLNDKITIKFHRNPSDVNSDDLGFVSALHFNQIN